MSIRILYLYTFVIVILSQNLLITPTTNLALVPAVSHQLNFTFSSRTIGSSSQVVVFLSNNYNSNPQPTDCYFATTNSVSYSLTTCSASSNSSGVYVSFANIYPNPLNSETILSLKVDQSLT